MYKKVNLKVKLLFKFVVCMFCVGLLQLEYCIDVKDKDNNIGAPMVYILS